MSISGVSRSCSLARWSKSWLCPFGESGRQIWLKVQVKYLMNPTVRRARFYDKIYIPSHWVNPVEHFNIRCIPEDDLVYSCRSQLTFYDSAAIGFEKTPGTGDWRDGGFSLRLSFFSQFVFNESFKLCRFFSRFRPAPSDVIVDKCQVFSPPF